MSDVIREQILKILSSETKAGQLGDRLFSQGGLFSQLAPTEQDRKALVNDPIYRQAMSRFTELRRLEASRFAQAIACPPASSHS